MFLGTVVYAVINSVILALMAIGFNLTFGISGVANFAYGALYVIAAYVSWMLLNLLNLPYFISALLSILFTTLLGALMYRFVLLRVRGQALSEVIATFGIGLVILVVGWLIGRGRTPGPLVERPPSPEWGTPVEEESPELQIPPPPPVSQIPEDETKVEGPEE